MNTNKVCQLVKWLLSSHAQMRLAWPLSDKTQMCTAQDIADDLGFFFEQHLHPFADLLLRQNWVWSYYAVLKMRSNAEIVCHKQTVMTRVAGGRRLVLKPLLTTTTYLTRWLTSYSVEQLHLKICPLHCFTKRYLRKMAKKEVANVFWCYLPNLAAILDCKTFVHDITAGYNLTRDKSSSLTQISAGLCYTCIFNWAYFWVMI